MHVIHGIVRRRLIVERDESEPAMLVLCGGRALPASVGSRRAGRYGDHARCDGSGGSWMSTMSPKGEKAAWRSSARVSSEKPPTYTVFWWSETISTDL